MKSNKFSQIIDEINKSDDIIITTHLNPDGDGLGAGLALFLGLNKYMKSKEEFRLKNIRFVIEDSVPENIKFLVGSEAIERFSNYFYKEIPTLVLSLDAASASRIGAVSEFLGKTTFVNIDHHVSNENYGNINFVDAESASTSEIIYELLEEMQIEFDKNIAEALYTGIVNDTGNFKHSNVRESTFIKAAKLISYGVDNTKIVEKFFDNRSMAGFKLLARGINNIEFFSEKKLITTFITQKDFEECGGNKFDTDGFAPEILQYNDAEYALFMREESSGEIKGSLRTKSNEINLNEIAGAFNGGGHKKAAGFSTTLPKDEIIKKVLSFL